MRSWMIFVGYNITNIEKDINKRKVLNGTHYLLLSNGEDIFDKEYKTRLDNALDMNKPLSQAYYLKAYGVRDDKKGLIAL